MNTATEPTATAQPSAALTTRQPKALSPEAAKWELQQRAAMAFSKSTLLPVSYRGDAGVPNVLIAMDIAERIGCSIFMVAQNLNIVHGRPGWASTFLIGTVNASKRFSPLRFQFEGAPNTDEWGCRAIAKDLSDGEPCKGALVTIAMAKAEGWYGRKSREGEPASKWPTMPEQMLMYRAAAFWTRVYCPELSLGMQTSEEIDDTTIDVPYTATIRPDGKPPSAKPNGTQDYWAEQIRACPSREALSEVLSQAGADVTLSLEDKLALKSIADAHPCMKQKEPESGKGTVPPVDVKVPLVDPLEPPFGKPNQGASQKESTPAPSQVSSGQPSPAIDWRQQVDMLKDWIVKAYQDADPQARTLVGDMVKKFVEGPPIPPGELADELQRFLRMTSGAKK